MNTVVFLLTRSYFIYILYYIINYLVFISNAFILYVFSALKLRQISIDIPIIELILGMETISSLH